MRISEQRRDYKKGEPESKLLIHSLETDHVLNFDNHKYIKSNCNNYHSRIFLEGWYSRINKFTLNNLSKIPDECAVLL